jgi:hypothetical protein
MIQNVLTFLFPPLDYAFYVFRPKSFDVSMLYVCMYVQGWAKDWP